MEDELENECVLMGREGRVWVESGKLSKSDMEQGSVLLRTLFAEVCGTDVHLLHGRLNTVPYPIIPGHVAVGQVHFLCGPVSDVEGVPIKFGDVVTFLDVIDTCNSCLSCLVDKQTTRCPFRRVIGITCTSNTKSIRGLLGGWSSYIYLPPNTKIIKLPEQLSPRVFISGGCGLPTALHAVDRANVRLMDRVVIQGSGPVGLLAALLAQASGAVQVVVIGAPAHRLEVVKSFGIKLTINIEETRTALERREVVKEKMGGRLADVVIEATGRPEAVAEGLELCRDGGTYVVVGQYTDNGSVDVNPHFQINRKHITIKGSWGSDFSHFYRGVQFMARMSHLPWDLVVSKVYALKDAKEALASVEKLEVFKALLSPAVS
ncbi:hypothetical protein GOP47_0001326 [Adiantum capillus-veneris]|uniref:Alcohol dehydrogenase n=1 Tax=Adiantum capillus-veneris TaxID=13818 RepID=A0A9D4V8H3_ADICA|nr:hypothetical protein GOP47_0001326 [Adiantum capillus-veneris]